MWEGFQTGGGHWVGDRYKTDIQTEWGIDFIRKNRRGPFSLVISYYPPHTPRTAPEEYVDLYEGRFQPEYYGMVSKIDDNVGELMTCLDDLDLTDNTLVVYTTDHGEVWGKYWNKHSKRICYDDGARLPAMFSWPGHLPRGVRTQSIACSADFAPSILDICGVPTPEGVQGRSLASVLDGRGKGPRDYVVIENKPVKSQQDQDERCVVTSDWKLILSTKRAPELYHVKVDIEDTNNVFDTAKGKAALPGLAAQMREWATETKDKIAPKLLDSLKAEGAALAE
jgi:arylsulfatase A-like enzyme